MIEVTGLTCSFGKKQVLKGIDLSIKNSEIVGLIGPSGHGKSVLLKVMAGIYPADSGKVLIKDGSSIGLMFQEGALFDSLNVLDNVSFPLVSGRVPITLLPAMERQRVEAQALAILDRVGLRQAALKMPGQLSGGMRRRASLARALVAHPDLVLLDDPTSGLDPVASRVIMDLILELHQEYKPTMLLVSQDLRRLLPSVERILALFDGKIIFSGKVSDLAAYKRSDADDSAQSLRELTHFVSCRYELTD
jgi:phospholipid/cholesterol/gamma-HCH transport system ATP-binding protein